MFSSSSAELPASSRGAVLQRAEADLQARAEAGAKAAVHGYTTAAVQVRMQGQSLVRGLPIDPEYSIIFIHRWKTI